MLLFLFMQLLFNQSDNGRIAIYKVQPIGFLIKMDRRGDSWYKQVNPLGHVAYLLPIGRHLKYVIVKTSYIYV